MIDPEGCQPLAATPPVSLRLGCRLIRGLAQPHIDSLVRPRRNDPFRSFAEFVRRTGLRAPALKRLAEADAFGSLGLDRQSTLWKSLPEHGPLTVYDSVDRHEDVADLPPLAPLGEVLADSRAAGLTLRQHPISFLRPALDALNIVPSDRLPSLDGDPMLSVAGVVLLRQRPATAKGVTFVTLEDETGPVNLIVHQATWERYRRVARTSVAMIAHGRLQKDREVIHVLVTRLDDLSERLGELAVRSRDFH
jgi:error-prone DNA polymerase